MQFPIFTETVAILKCLVFAIQFGESARMVNFNLSILTNKPTKQTKQTKQKNTRSIFFPEESYL